MPPNNDQIDYKLLNKLVKLQEDREKKDQDQSYLLLDSINQLNKLIEQLIYVGTTGSTVAATKKYIPFQTGTTTIPIVQKTQPTNPDDYASIVNVYAQNDSKPIQHMTLINDGPGNIFFIVAHSKNDVSTQEGLIRVNDQRELFNVYEVRLRTDLPLTSFRLIEGIFRTGSFAPATKASVEIRLTPQANEKVKFFDALFDINVPTITINSPATNTIAANYGISSFMPPLPPGHTAALVDLETGLPMPFLIPTGFILEGFDFTGNFSTDYTLRVYLEPIPDTKAIFGQTILSLRSTIPITSRGLGLNLTSNVNSYSTQGIDPNGAPAPGRLTLDTITNDDPFNNMIGNIFFRAVIRKLG